MTRATAAAGSGSDQGVVAVGAAVARVAAHPGCTPLFVVDGRHGLSHRLPTVTAAHQGARPPVTGLSALARPWPAPSPPITASAPSGRPAGSGSSRPAPGPPACSCRRVWPCRAGVVLHDADQVAFGVGDVDQPARPRQGKTRDEDLAAGSEQGRRGGVEVGHVNGRNDQLTRVDGMVGAAGVGAVVAQPGIITGGDHPAVRRSVVGQRPAEDLSVEGAGAIRVPSEDPQPHPCPTATSTDAHASPTPLTVDAAWPVAKVCI